MNVSVGLSLQTHPCYTNTRSVERANLSRESVRALVQPLPRALCLIAVAAHCRAHGIDASFRKSG